MGSRAQGLDSIFQGLVDSREHQVVSCTCHAVQNSTAHITHCDLHILPRLSAPRPLPCAAGHTRRIYSWCSARRGARGPWSRSRSRSGLLHGCCWKAGFTLRSAGAWPKLQITRLGSRSTSGSGSGSFWPSGRMQRLGPPTARGGCGARVHHGHPLCAGQGARSRWRGAGGGRGGPAGRRGRGWL